MEPTRYISPIVLCLSSRARLVHMYMYSILVCLSYPRADLTECVADGGPRVGVVLLTGYNALGEFSLAFRSMRPSRGTYLESYSRCAGRSAMGCQTPVAHVDGSPELC